MTITKVRSGEPLRMSAEAFNAFVDAAAAHHASRQNRTADGESTSSTAGVILVRNDSGADQGRFAVLGLGDPLISPSANAQAFQERIAFAAVELDAERHARRFVILQEPIASGAVGRGLVMGCSPVRLDVQSADDELAAVVTATSGTLTTGAEGGARILWKEDGTGELWGIVQIPVGAEGGGSANLVVEVTQPGHGWLLADVLHWTGTAWEFADPASVGATDTLAVVGKIPDDDTALLVLWGVLCLEGLQPHTDYWLDPATPGALTATKPSAAPRLVLHHSERGLCVVRAGTMGSGAGVDRFADLVDVDVTTTPPADRQAPLWDAAAERWVPGAVVTADPVPANTVLAGPGSGADAAPEFRHLILEDLPELQPCSVIANATAIALPPTALAALEDDRALLRVGGALQWLQITSAILADNAVTTEKIAPGAVDTMALADEAVTTAKIADAAITDAKIVSLTWAKLIGVPPTFPPSPHDHPLGGDLTGTTSAAQIAPDAVGTAELADGAVTTAKLAAMGGPAVLGRPGAGAGAPTAIAAATEGGVLRRSGGIISFARITDLEVAVGAAIAWSKIAKTGAVASDVGAAPATHTHPLAGLSDVVITTPTVGQVLAYDAVNGRWINDDGGGGPGTMRPLSVWVNPTNANAEGTDLPAGIDNRALLRVAGTIAWTQVNRQTLTDGSPYSVIGRATATSGPVADITADVSTVLRRGVSGDLAFGKIVSAHIDSGLTDDGWVLTTGPIGQLLWARTVTLGKGAGTPASVQGALVVVISNTGDYAKISSAGIELFRRSVSTVTPLVKLDLNAYATWTVAKAMGIREIDVCDNGVAKKMLVLGSAAF